MLEFYEGELDRSAIADEQCEITPKIYGKDVRRDRIYRALEDYFEKTEDPRIIEARLERLRCHFSGRMLSKFYDCCEAYQQTDRFLEGLEQVIREKEIMTQAECNALEKFLRDKRQQLDGRRVRDLQTLVRRKQSGSRLAAALV